jgi:transcriptional regulatory protein RtcR
VTTPKTVVIGLFGTVLDATRSAKRWKRWRPTVSLFQHEDLLIDRLDLLGPASAETDILVDDIHHLSPSTEVALVPFDVADPWDFEAVYEALLTYAEGRTAEHEDTRTLVHITTGTHVAQICLFLLTEARFLRGELIQSAPGRGGDPPSYLIVDLNLSRYDRIAKRFDARQRQGSTLLKQGIATRNVHFNRMIDELELVAERSKAPILITGPTGAGKTHLARRIHELKQARGQLDGPMVEVNCATVRGDLAMSVLFGHRRGAFTGAQTDRAGLLAAADGGMLFLDEIGELGLDEQAMLLRAIEEKRFTPVGSDREVCSDFQLVAGTNRDLGKDVAEGRFREDLLARIDLWSFRLPGLADRPEDVAPNLEHELEQLSRKHDRRVTMTTEARDRFVAFGTGPGARWAANFRDLNAAMTRMATLSSGGRIGLVEVEAEVVRLRTRWRTHTIHTRVQRVLGDAHELDRFDQVQLEDVLAVCAESATQSSAGRTLFAVSRGRRKQVNDADRLRKYLGKFGLTWLDVKERLS